MASEEDIYKKWSFIEDPEAVKYREKADNCASTIIRYMGASEVSSVINQTLKEDSLKKAFMDSMDLETGLAKKCGVVFEAHPKYDGVKCAECFDTNVFTRCFYHPVTFRSFYFCFSCSEDFIKQGYVLLE